MKIPNNEAIIRMDFRLGYSQLVRFAVAVILTVGVVVASPASSFAGGLSDSARRGEMVSSDLPLIAYSVDYEMDRARGEKTIEHYGEPVRDVVEQAIKNNENNPRSKSTAENTYRRESWLNDLLPERLGQFFSKDDLLDMPNTDNPRER